MTEVLSTAVYKLGFGVSKSLRYHAYRRSFWSYWDRITKILTIVTGAATFIVAYGESPKWTIWPASLVAILSACDIVIGFSTNARDHDKLYRDFSALAQAIALQPNPTENDLARWLAERLRIEADEPTTIDLLERRCSAEEARARGTEVLQEWDLTACEIRVSQYAFLPALLWGCSYKPGRQQGN